MLNRNVRFCLVVGCSLFFANELAARPLSHCRAVTQESSNRAPSQQESAQQQRASDERIRHELANWQSTLSDFGITPTAKGAQEFLANLIPESDRDDEIAGLILQLDSDDYQLRLETERKLVSTGTAALGQLQQALRADSPEVRLRAKHCIDRISLVWPSVVVAAIHVLRLDELEEGDSGEPSSQRRVELLQQLNGVVSKEAKSALIDAIVANADSNSRNAIVQGLDSKDQLIRLASVRSLEACVSIEELAKFQSLIIDQDSQVSIAAIKSFGKQFPELTLRHLTHTLLESESFLVRNQAIAILRRVSGMNFEFSEYAEASKRDLAVRKWKEWSLKNAKSGELDFSKIDVSVFPKPSGFVVSVSGLGATYLDANGKALFAQGADVYDAQDCGDRRLLVCERSKGRVLLIDLKSGEPLRTVENVDSPTDAELLADGNILVLQGAGKITEHDIKGNIVRTIEGLNNPFDVDRLPNGNTIVADSGNDRLVEFRPDGSVVWEKPGLKFPNNVFRMDDNRTLYTTYTSGEVVMLNADSKELWRTNLSDGTLYSVYCGGGEIYVSDGGNSKIWVLGMDGKQIRSIDVEETFCDVGFVTK